MPHRNPRFNKMTDADFITVISWCEDWEPEKVYNTAYKESHLDYLLTWEEWSKDMQSLPMPVRAELERARKFMLMLVMFKLYVPMLIFMKAHKRSLNMPFGYS